MPAGLDGNPDPIRSPARDAVLEAVAGRVRTHTDQRLIVGVDGRSGSGKSTFADELAAVLGRHHGCVVRSTTDSFHQPRAARLAAGEASASGFYRDSHQLDLMRDNLFAPFAAGATTVQVAAFDEPRDCKLVTTIELDPSAILVFDGLFLQRPELRDWWTVSVYLDGNRRLASRWLSFLLDDLSDDPVTRADEIDERLRRARWPRYRAGWEHYVEHDNPAASADIVIDNNDFAHPSISRSAPGASRSRASQRRVDTAPPGGGPRSHEA